ISPSLRPPLFPYTTLFRSSTGLVPATLGLWTMANLVTFILNAIFWELLLVGIPVVVGVAAGWLWLRRLPDEEMRGYHSFRRRSRSEEHTSELQSLAYLVCR